MDVAVDKYRKITLKNGAIRVCGGSSGGVA